MQRVFQCNALQSTLVTLRSNRRVASQNNAQPTCCIDDMEQYFDIQQPYAPIVQV